MTPMKSVATNLRPWIAGTVVAFSGVGIVRMAAAHLSGPVRVDATLVGYLIAAVGLFIIARGVNHRLQGAGKQVPPG